MTSLRRLPIDQYQRYRLVADLAERMRTEGRPLRVLDIGGRTGLLRRFLPSDRVFAVDREGIEGARDLVLGDGARLPFADGSFDLVCGFDTLEHVPPADREEFVAECLRASRGHVVLIGPWAGSRIAQAERHLSTFLKDKLELVHRYLEEHHQYGLPSRRAATAWMKERGAQVTAIGQGNLQRWLALMCIEIYLEADPDLQRFAPRLYEFYNANLYSSDNRAPVYRHALIAAVGDATLPDLEGIFGPDQEQPELFEALNRFLPDLMGFDRAKGRWREERRRFTEMVQELRTELEAHRVLVGKLRGDFEDQLRVTEEVSSLREEELSDREAVANHVAHLEAELSKMSETAARLEQNRRSTQAELDAVIADRETIRSTLEEVAADRDRLRVDRDAVLTDRDAILAHRDEIEADRARLTDRRDHAVDERNRVVAEHEGAAARFGARLGEIEQDRAALRERADHLEELLAQERARLATFDHQRLAAVEGQLEGQTRALESLRIERNLLAGQLDLSNREREALLSRVAQLERSVEREQHGLTRAKADLDGLRSRILAEFGEALSVERRVALGLERAPAAGDGSTRMPDVALRSAGIRAGRARAKRRHRNRRRR